jgi:hypothetical protein
MMFKEQAENCRQQANDFIGRPEAPFLLRVASAFDELAVGKEGRPLMGNARRRPLATSTRVSA